MTREEARKAAEVMMAYADGKDVEYLTKDMWELCSGSSKNANLALDFNKYKYRIKKEPIYRPFKDKDECWAEMQKHQPFGWVIDNGVYNCIIAISDMCKVYSSYILAYDKAFKNFTFADGTPFGIKDD